MPKAYIYTMGLAYLIYLITLMAKMVTALRVSYVANADKLGKKWGVAVFTAWKMTVEDVNSANQLKEKITKDLKEMLEHSSSKKRSTPIERQVIRTATFLLTFGLICFVGWLAYESQENEERTGFLVPLSFSFIVLIAPYILNIFQWLENYRTKTRLYMRLIQTSLLVTVVLTVLKFTTILGEDHDEGETCKETTLGQEIYSLLIFYFFVNVLLHFITETIRRLLYSLFCQNSLPSFDVPGHTTSLIYCQMLTAFGLFYSPLLPAVTCIILILSFYLGWASLRLNFMQAKKSWTDSATKTVYLTITFLSSLIPFVFFLFTLTIKSSSYCGPFRDVEYPFLTTGIMQGAVGSVVFSGAVWAAMVVFLAVILYYVRSSAVQKKRHGKSLFLELQGDKKELKTLRKECVKYGVTD